MSLFRRKPRQVTPPLGAPYLSAHTSTPMLTSILPREAPFSIEPVLAWRAWAVDLSRPHRGPFLRSITYKMPWPERRAVHAHCMHQIRRPRPQVVHPSYSTPPPTYIKHECPDAGHRCGIYALKEPSEISKWATATNYVGGNVRLWGRVFLYERGYIAEYAYPIALTFRNNPDVITDEIGEILAEKYGIEVAW